MAKPQKIGIALSGGGARGIAHIGVLDALLSNGIVPEVVSGTSAGAIIGAMYAAGITPEQMLDFVKESSILKIFRLTLPDKGLASLKYLQERLEEIIPDNRFETLQKPLYIAITNLLTGKLEIRHKGELHQVIMASSAIPLVFQPIRIGDALYVDGGTLQNLPAAPIRRYSEVLIGVNVMPHEPVEEKEVSGMVGIATRCFEMAIWANMKPELKRCDIIIAPNKTRHYNLFKLHKYKELYEIGYVATMLQMPDIKAQLLAKAAAE